MKEKQVNIHELVEQTMEALLKMGLSRQTVWGSYSSHYLPIGKYFRNQGCEYYDTSILGEYCLMLQNRCQNKEITAHTMRVREKAVENVMEVYETGKIIWSCQSPKTKFRLTDNFESVAADFLTANKNVHHLEWGVRKYLSYLQQNGHESLDTIAVYLFPIS